MAGEETFSASDFEMLAAQAYDEFVITEVIRPAAVLPESAAREVLVEMALRDVNTGGQWRARPGDWHRYDRPWPSVDDQGGAQLLGSMQVAYGTPTKYEITIYRATITSAGTQQGWTVESLCNEALGLGGLTLSSCPRADLLPPPRPFHF
ncbi:MAG: hypothetical protein DLM59_01600 [Pseudonocardiales bacterium]|nr:MAG: hypothetical protein DLM59_01600 [Pseudonocardiales bacterium]